ncbi:low molecular weight phosphotyrosine protein phosphatase [bacterium BMS3Abin03]|nr:low molecular weight phosphotyrosine protein phosphatase [bacterium BMS3Abin03]MCG6960159.1 low molecular weight phosphotyrosine protein phosphatase [bacterium BMS3Abin03]
MTKKKILFVCMGNICRSPAAEAIMKKKINENRLSHKFEVDSAGTIDYHVGEQADPRMIGFAANRGYIIDSVARQFDPKKDFNRFDYIVTMDNNNYDDIKLFDKDDKYDNKIFRMVDFCETFSSNKIPDPYYSGKDGFDLVLDMLEDSTKGLLNKVLGDVKQQNKI